MTNPTPHGQVPEALRLAALLLNLQTHMGPRRPSHPDDAHCWDGYTQASAELRRLHAENEALRTAHVRGPAEIEHVAGDVSKNGPESNMAQQPTPSTATAGQRRSDLVPGVMHCAKCKFQLNRVTLCVSDGNAYAGNNETEPCPNGCGPLWPVTWEQEARNCWKALEEMRERLHPAPTPQADSQPAPVEELDDDACRCEPSDYVRPADYDGDGSVAAMARRAASATEDSVTAPAGGGVAGPEWKWVPVDATDAMVRATDKVNFENEDTDGTIHNVWNTMLAAAPTPSVTPSAASIAWNALRDLTDPLGDV